MPASLGHINLVCEDLDAATTFFVDNFGFVAGEKILLEGPWVDKLNGMKDVKAEYVKLTLEGSTTNIELLKFHTPPAEANPNVCQPNLIGFRHINFVVDDIDAMVARLQDEGWTFLSPVQTVSAMNLKTVYFRGPEDVLMQMIQHL